MRAAAAQIEIKTHRLSHIATRYEGQMQGGKFNGKGVKTYADVRVESGEWETGMFLGQATAADRAAMQAKYPEAKECAALVKLGLRATDTVRVMHSTGLYYHIALTLVVPIGCVDVICAHHIV